MICFLSYARKDRESDKGTRDAYFTSFVEDLRDNLVKLSGDENPLFVDEVGIGPGADWPETLANALRDCRVFAYLHSPIYFQRSSCGKEWRVFRTRMEEVGAVAENPNALSPMIPIHWLPITYAVTKIPTEIAKVQFSFAGMDERY